MLASIFDFASLLLAGLLTGAIFGAWLFLNPAALDTRSYITVQQQGIRTLNTAMPALGALTILATILAAVLGGADRVRLLLLVSAAACFVAVGLVTRFLNQPINAVVIQWSPDSPPQNWTELRDAWWRWHLVRLAVALAGQSLLILAALKRPWN